MRKSTIWLLVVIMALSFAGLLLLQIFYMDNMIKMRNEHFSEAVKRVLYSVSQILEQDETKRYLEEDMEAFQRQLMINEKKESSTSVSQIPIPTEQHFSMIHPDGSILTFSFNGPKMRPIPPKVFISPNHGSNTIVSTNRNMQELLNKKYIYQQGILDEVILNILATSSNRPILERIDTRKLSNYLTLEFQNNGLNIPFEYAIVNRAGNIIYSSPDYNPKYKMETFSQVLFPNDPPSRLNVLKVYFPTKMDYIFSSVRFMIPSFAFTLILLFTFVLVIILILRQKKLTEMKSDFINNMTHEFKTPISTISLAAQMLNDNSVAKNPVMFQNISNVINDETKRLRFQVEKVLQMSMFDRQKTMLKLVPAEANNIVSGVLSTFKLKVEKYGGTIEADLSATNDTVMVDEMHFTNVIFNLLDNAVKYAKEDVPIVLFVKTWNDGNKFELSIQDNGIGIRKEDLKKIFERFYRVSTGNVHNVKGFGLGLAYVQKIIKDLKGSIRVESEINVGTKFIITLPNLNN